MSTPTETFPAGAAVDVLCDGSGRLGALSYKVPTGLKVRVGDAVHVPFGRREVHGVVLGPGDSRKATREVLDVFGRRVHRDDLAVVDELAARHFSDRRTLAPRLSPPNGRGHPALEAGPVVLDPSVSGPALPTKRGRYFLLRAPLVDPVALAAREAARIAAHAPGGQVLVLCPTVAYVEATLACFTSGAARVDRAAPTGAWRGLIEGTVPIAIGTRTAALYSAAKLAGIVVVEDDQPGHLESRQPYTHAREIALLRARRSRAALSIIGAAPTAASLDGVRVVPVGSARDWPKIRVIDRTQLPPHDQLAPPVVRAALDRARRAGHEPVVLTERSRARRRCVRCGISRGCSECFSTRTTCAHDLPPCPNCEEPRTRLAGWDARRLTQLLGEPLRAVDLPELGTLTDAGLACVFDIDVALGSPSLFPEDLATRQLTAAARAAGRGGTLWVLTRDPTHPLLCDLLGRRDQMAAAQRAWSSAKERRLPPFGRLVKIATARARAPRVAGWPGRVLGPRQRGKDWEILVQVDDDQLGELTPFIERLRRGGKVRVTVS